MRKREEEERQMKRFGIFMNTYNFDLYSKMLFNGQKNGEQETIIHHIKQRALVDRRLSGERVRRFDVWISLKIRTSSF